MKRAAIITLIILVSIPCGGGEAPGGFLSVDGTQWVTHIPEPALQYYLGFSQNKFFIGLDRTGLFDESGTATITDLGVVCFYDALFPSQRFSGVTFSWIGVGINTISFSGLSTTFLITKVDDNWSSGE